MTVRALPIAQSAPDKAQCDQAPPEQSKIDAICGASVGVGA
jgi:hypothetical protein